MISYTEQYTNQVLKILLDRSLCFAAMQNFGFDLSVSMDRQLAHRTYDLFLFA